ncbi:hypothetical protein GCM10027169_05700 [Gordonia jinhuaensis]|uniref:Uncharacterized protein n=1 Tax=Gordonia jinhuaensis TaxID=1517702 RepID=A0A916WPR4_9ACTN|nr:hypothetical protein [Gordonia jinhuaensis]GGB18026.1 hypothetical protein GCM10011489_02660 [Gordonia jinhuaensis]
MTLHVAHFGHSTNQREFTHHLIDICHRYDSFGGTEFHQTVTPADDGHTVTVHTVHASGEAHSLVYDLSDCLTQTEVHKVAERAFDDTYGEVTA